MKKILLMAAALLGTLAFAFTVQPVSSAAAGSLQISVPNGHVYWNNGDSITTAFSPSETITANFVTMNCLDDNINDPGDETFEVAITTDSGGSNVIASAQITNNFRNTGGCDAHKYSFDFGDVTLTGGTTYYLRTKVLAGAEVRAWNEATLYYGIGSGGAWPSYSSVEVPVPNGHVYWNDGDFITTSFSLPESGIARFVTMCCLDDNGNDAGSETFEVAITTDSGGSNVIASAQITNNFRNTGGCDEHTYLFDFLDVPLAGGPTYYLRTKVLAGAEVRTWWIDRLHYTPIPGPAVLNTNAVTDSGDDQYPQVTTDGQGNWLAVWESTENLGGTIGTDADILVARSTDGITWTAPAALNTNAATDSGDDQLPQVASDGAGNWVAVWQSTENLDDSIGTDLDILVARSTNNGATWTAPAALNTNATTDSGSDERPQVTSDGAGNWVAVWDSTDDLGVTIGTDNDILVARSTDNGATWTAPAALNTNADTDSGYDYSPQVTTDGRGKWVAAWYSTDDLSGTIGGDFDILVSRSTDAGATWTAPVALNTNAASDSGHDYSPQVTTDGRGKWVAVWTSWDSLGGTIGLDLDIFVARSTDNGANWTAPAALNTNAGTDTGSDYSPEVTTDAGGNWVTVWFSNENLGGIIGTDWDILVARSTDSGATWTAPAALNSNAASDSGDDEWPQVTTDGAGSAGNWLTVWASDDDLGGTIGTDYDILYAHEWIPIPPVGGVAELPEVSESAGRSSIALAGLAAAALAALTAGGWYARRRLS